MIGIAAFFIIVFSSLAGFFGVSMWIVPLGAIGLASLSAFEHRRLYAEAREAGLPSLTDETLLGSIINGCVASSLAYGVGLFFQLLSPT